MPTPVAELERLEIRHLELQAEIRERNAGYSINWSEGPPTPTQSDRLTPKANSQGDTPTTDSGTNTGKARAFVLR